jgi:hypothetical protein
VLERILFGELGGPGGINLIARNGASLLIHMKTQNREPSFGSQGSQKQALSTLPVIDELTAHSQMKPFASLREIMNLHVRPVFAETVGQYAIRGCGAIKVHEGFHTLENTNALHGGRRPRAVPNLHFDLRKCRP